MEFKHPFLGPTIRNKTINSVTIVIHGDRKYKYGYVCLNKKTLCATFNENKYYGHRFVFDDLEEGHEYNYQATTSNKYHQMNINFGSKVYNVRTLSNDEYTLAFGSCRFYPNIFGMFSIGSNISGHAFKEIDNHGVDSLYIIGDHPYMDISKKLSLLRLKSRDDIFDNHIIARSTKGFKLLASGVDVIELPDDHEYRDNGTPEIGISEPDVYQNAIDGINVFQIHSGPHAYGSNVKYWKHVDKGSCEVFLCDTRYEREEENIMSDEQYGALRLALINKPSNKPFLLFSPVPFLLEQHGDDMWNSYPKYHTDLLNFIYHNDIRNVFVLTGDAHISCAAAFNFYEDTITMGNKIVEIISSPLFQISKDNSKLICNTFAVDEHLSLKSPTDILALRGSVIKTNNFAIIDVLHDKLLVTYYKSSNGERIYSKTYSYW